MLDVFYSVFGEYAPIINTITLADGTEKIIESVNYGYICSVAVFCIAFYSMFKIIGTIFKGVR